MKYHGIKAECFCDRAKSGGTYLGVPVYTYEKILELGECIVLLAVGAAFNDALDFLVSKGISNIYSVHNLIFADTEFELEELSQQGQDLNYYEKLYSFGSRYRKNSDKMSLFSLDWVITERCSLRCKDCSNLMQYFKRPINYDKKTLINEMYRLLEHVDEIMDLRIIGGEPFMNPQMAELMSEFLDCKQINNFSIYTNATILPDIVMLQVMKHPKVKLEVSDYGELAKNLPRFLDILNTNHIRYNLVKNDVWHKLGK